MRGHWRQAPARQLEHTERHPNPTRTTSVQSKQFLGGQGKALENHPQVMSSYFKAGFFRNGAMAEM